MGGFTEERQSDLLGAISGYFAVDDTPGATMRAKSSLLGDVARRVATTRCLITGELANNKIGPAQAAIHLFDKCSRDGKTSWHRAS